LKVANHCERDSSIFPVYQALRDGILHVPHRKNDFPYYYGSATKIHSTSDFISINSDVLLLSRHLVYSIQAFVRRINSC
jgi:hypothetical protein